MDFVGELLGTPQFVERAAEGREQRLYRLHNAWVAIEIHDGAVMSYSITVTSPALRYSTKRLTFGLIDIRLGWSAFDSVQVEPDGEKLWVGARRYGYLQHHRFGNPGRYQDYWLSYNLAGCGMFAAAGHSGDFASGSYGSQGSVAPSRSAITINTLTVLGPNCPADAIDEFLKRGVLGTDADSVRLDATGTQSPQGPRRLLVVRRRALGLVKAVGLG